MRHALLPALAAALLAACGGGGAASAPAAPAAVTAIAGNAQATVSFVAPASDGGSPVSGYTVSSFPPGGVDSDAGSAATVHVVKGLSNGYLYSFSVTAENARGSSPPSAYSLGVVPTTRPPSGSGLWRGAATLQVDRLGHSASLLADGKVLVVGGAGDGRLLASAELYDPATGRWESAGALAVARQYHTATLLADGRVLVVGGSGSDSYPSLASAELYDPASRRWSSAGSLRSGRTLHSATLLANGQVLVAGGDAGGSSLQDSFYPHPLASAELFDPASNAWAAAAALSTARWRHTSSLLRDGRVLVAGGARTDGKHSIAVATAELYDPQSNQWSAASSLAAARFGHTATPLTTGAVLVAGGFGSDGNLASSEIYDPGSGLWKTAGRLSTARSGHSATLLASGKVLVAGGRTYVSIADAELYSLGTDTWEQTGALAVAREAQVATLLADGTVLVAGGYSSIGLAGLASAEIYGKGDGD